MIIASDLENESINKSSININCIDCGDSTIIVFTFVKKGNYS